MKKEFSYFGLKVIFYCFFNEEVPSEDLLFIKKNIQIISQKFNLDYGVFNSAVQDEIISNSGMMFVFNSNDELIGFFVIPIFSFNDLKVCNEGFVFLTENKIKIDFLNTLCSKLNEFIFDKIGKFYIFSITKNPLVFEGIFQNFDNIWPNPKEMRWVNNKIYLDIFDFMSKKYVEKFTSPQETLVFDKKRFVLKYENSVSSLDKRIEDLSKAQLLENNLFLQYWLKESQNEMIVLVGEYNYKNKIKNNKRIAKIEKKMSKT